jgi:hypothetical protein
MGSLYWSFEEREFDALLGRLHEWGHEVKPATMVNGLMVIHVPEPSDRILQETLKLIAWKRLKSAALVATALSPKNLFVAVEWWDRFVIESSELKAVRHLKSWLRNEREYKPLDLIIFEIHDAADDTEVRDGGDSVSFGDFIVQAASAEAVQADPKRFYGRFASPDVGGANVLFAVGQEAAEMRGLGTSTVLVGAPDVFGFDVDDDQNSVVRWRQKGAIAVEAFGFSLTQWHGAVKQWDTFPLELLDEAATTNEIVGWLESGLQFGLAMVLRGLNDPPVVIPMGSIYQQPVMGLRSQNLAVAKAGVHMVGAGATVPLVLPAWCLNPTFSPPYGPLTPTPLVATASGSQQSVWNGIRRRYGAGA